MCSSGAGYLVSVCLGMCQHDVCHRAGQSPPDGGWGWCVVFAVCVMHVITDGIVYSSGIFFVEFVDRFKESKGATALIASLLLGSMLCTGPLASAVISKFGPRMAVIFGSLLSSCCLFASAFATSIFLLYFTVGLGTGIGFCIINLAGVVCVSDYFDKKRSLAVGIALSGSGIGTFVLGPTIGWIISKHGWQMAITFAAVLVTCCIVLSLFFCSAKHYDDGNDGATEASIKREDDNKDVSNKVSLMREPIFIIFTISSFLTSFGFSIPYIYIVAQAEAKGVQPELCSYMVSAIGISNMFGRLVLGYVSDKMDPLNLYRTCLTICGLSTALSILCFSFTHFLVYTAVFGFTIAAYTGFTSIVLIHLLGLNRLTSAYGLLLFFQGIASLIGPPFTGWLSDLTGSYNPVFYISGLTIAASGFMLYFMNFMTRCCCV